MEHQFCFGEGEFVNFSTRLHWFLVFKGNTCFGARLEIVEYVLA